jgi:AraC-like DNA-binding protein
MAHLTVLVDSDPALQPRVLLCRASLLEEWSAKDLSAPFWRCYVPLGTGGSIHGLGQTWPLRPGIAIVIAPGTVFAASLQRPFRKAYLHFVCPTRVSENQGIATHPVPAARLRTIRSAVNDGDGERLQLGLLAQALDSVAAIAPAPATVYSPLITRTIALLREHLNAPLSNRDLGKHFELHPNSLVRRFTEEVGEPPQRFAMALRLDAAAECLVAGDRSIDAIAEDFSFVDRNHFSRAFTRRWACSPAEFRRRNRS